MENFKSPYFSTSIKEFWSRWHISLSTWFRDYVYIPLGGNRTKKFRHCLNLLITFLASGLWHGANWTFIVWGGLHGIAQILENIVGIRADKKKGSFRWVLRIVPVFIFVAFSWIFFRAQSFTEAIYVFSHMFYGISNLSGYLSLGLSNLDIGGSFALTYSCCIFGPLLIYDYLAARYDVDTAKLLAHKPVLLQWLIYIAVGLIIIFLSPKGVAAEFVYFQF